MNHYERAAFVYYTEQNLPLAISLFAGAIVQQADKSTLWYGLGESVCKLFCNQEDSEKRFLGVSFIKKAAELDTENVHAQEFLGNFPKSELAEIPDASTDTVKQIDISLSTENYIEAFNQLQSLDKKIALVMHLGETKDPAFFDFLKYCVLTQEESSIRFAALKRIPYFKEQNLKAFFNKLLATNQVTRNEPYFSIALAAINQPWANQLVNPEFAPANTGEKQFTHKEIQDSLADTNLRSVIALALYKHSKQNLREVLYHKRNKALVFHLTYGVNKSVVHMLLSKQILTDNGRATELAWKHLEEFLKSGFDIVEGQKNNTTKVAKEKAPEALVVAAQEPKRKWWELFL